ncbi:MAG: hypothetical protein ACYCUF_06465 [Acidimicrobiales bacterium]
MAITTAASFRRMDESTPEQWARIGTETMSSQGRHYYHHFSRLNRL